MIRTSCSPGWMVLVASTIFAAVVSGSPTPPEPITFQEIGQQAAINYHNRFGTPDKMYIIETIGNGAAWLDFNNDNWLDLFVANGSSLDQQEKGQTGKGNRLYRNNKDGTFTDVTGGARVQGGYWGSAAAAGDYNNDGWVDLYVTTILEGNHLYRNNGDGTFTDVTAEAKVGGDSEASSTAAFFDYNRDGHLDLYVANYVTFDRVYLDKLGPHCLWKGLRVMCGPVGVPGSADILYRNNGDGTFTDVTREAGVYNPELKSLGVMPADLNQDGWTDLYIASDSTRNALYRNRGDGTFEDVTLLSGAGFSQDGRAQAGMGVDAGDYDGDGLLDLFVTNFQDDDNTLYRNEGNLVFTEITYGAKLGQASFNRLGWGTGFRDFDNDGHLDLFVANGHVYPQVDDAELPETYAQQNQVFRNQGNGEFREISQSAGPALQEVKGSRGVAFGDYNNDGWIDLVVVNIDDRISLLQNVTRKENHWLTVRLVGTKSNRDGIGVQLRLKAGDLALVREAMRAGSYASANDPRVHFGLGKASSVENLEVIWPSGIKQEFSKLSVDQQIVIHEEKGILEGP